VRPAAQKQKKIVENKLGLKIFLHLHDKISRNLTMQNTMKYNKQLKRMGNHDRQWMF